MKRAYLIAGPESAGNRILAACLVRAGCHGAGSTQHEYQKRIPSGPSPVVLIRSMPHGGEWPNIRKVCSALSTDGYTVTVLVTARHPVPLIASQLHRRHHKTEAESMSTNREAYERLIPALNGVDWYMVPIESLFLNATALSKLLTLIGLPDIVTGPMVWEGVEQDGVIRDCNQKHYEGGIADG